MQLRGGAHNAAVVGGHQQADEAGGVGEGGSGVVGHQDGAVGPGLGRADGHALVAVVVLAQAAWGQRRRVQGLQRPLAPQLHPQRPMSAAGQWCCFTLADSLMESHALRCQRSSLEAMRVCLPMPGVKFAGDGRLREVAHSTTRAVPLRCCSSPWGRQAPGSLLCRH